jgi:2Fe-2S ferredoxin
MTEIVFILPSGERRSVDAPNGRSVMDAAIDNDVAGILADCGGACSCATCHVYVDPLFTAQVGTPGELESEMLDGASAPCTANSRLACQIEISPEIDGLIVHIAPTQI